jgi:hypothetical protein
MLDELRCSRNALLFGFKSTALQRTPLSRDISHALLDLSEVQRRHEAAADQCPRAAIQAIQTQPLQRVQTHEPFCPTDAQHHCNNRIRLVLFGMQNRTFGPYLAAMHRILIPIMQVQVLVFAKEPRVEGIYNGQVLRVPLATTAS